MNILLLKQWLREHAGQLTRTRLREVRQVNSKTVTLQLTAAEGNQSITWLCLSINETYPALFVADLQTLESQPEMPESNFAKALTFHLPGATLIRIDQQGFDRSVCFEFARKDIYGRETQRTLRLELVGRASNAYLLSEKAMVISMFKPVPPGRNSVRRVVTGKPLPDPPPLGKYIEAGDVNALQRELETAAVGDPLNPIRELLTRRVAGGEVNLWPRLEALDPPTDFTALGPFIAHLQAGELNSALFGLKDRSTNDAVIQAWSAAVKPAAQPVQKNYSSAGNTQRELAQQLALAARADELEQLALEMLGRADTFGTRELEVAYLKGWRISHTDWAERINLQKTARENSGALVEYAQRLRRARPKLEGMIEAGPTRLDVSEHSQLHAAGSEARTTKPKPDPLGRDISKLERAGVKFLRYVTGDGLTVIVGQSDRSNDELVRHYGSSRHLWLHVRDYPGSHVLLLTNGTEPPLRSLEEAAIVAGYYSQGRGELELEISYTPVKQLRRPKGGKPGQVLKLSEKVIRVNPMRFEELRGALSLNRSSAP